MTSASAAPGEPEAKKKHVRFARMEEREDENTLFDTRRDVSGGLKSALKGAARPRAGLEEAEIQRPGRSGAGACSRWLVTLTLCASFLGLVMAAASHRLALPRG